MVTSSNLAFAMDTAYNCIKSETNIKKLNLRQFSNRQFIIQTKQILILRENILASGMEVRDINKALKITKNTTRR